MDEPEEGYRLPVKFRYGDDYRKYFSVWVLLLVLVSTQQQTENCSLYFKFKFSFVYKFLNIIIIMNK